MSTPEYRYVLTRKIPGLGKKGSVLFVMLNPSTATETEDDPTIRRCMDFASLWGREELRVVNLFAMRATNPAEIHTAYFCGDDIVGPKNDEAFVSEGARQCREQGTDAPAIVAAWGASLEGLVARRLAMLSICRVDWHCLGMTANGSPRHPLYVRRSQPLMPWRPRAPV